MKHARRMMVCQVGRGSVPEDLLIDDCETAWTATTGLLRTVNATPTAGGSGYTAGDILDVTTGGAGGKVQVSTVDGGGAVTAIAHYAGGYGGYTTGAGKATSGGTGTGCTINITAIANPGISLQSATPTAHDGTYSLRWQGGTTIDTTRALLGYRAISPGSLAAYGKIKAWVYVSTAPWDGDEIALCFCSDAVGRVVTDEFILPPLADALAWVEVLATRTGGGKIATPQSIALYRLTGARPGPANYHFDNIRVSA